MDVLTVIASIASIFGAIFALSQAKKAKSAAVIALDAKEEVLGKRKIIDFISLRDEARGIESILIAQTSKNTTQTMGRDQAKENTQIESFISVVNERKSLPMQNELKAFFEEKYQALNNFNRATPKPFHDMLDCVRDIISKVSEEINKSTYL